MRKATLEAYHILDNLPEAPDPTLRKIIEKLSNAAQQGLTEGLIHRQRAHDLEEALIRRKKETKSKNKKLTEVIATTGAELLKLRQLCDEGKLPKQVK